MSSSTHPGTLTTGEPYTGNQQFKGFGVQRWCPICGCHRTIGGGSMRRVLGLKQWVCQQHPKVAK